MTAQDWFSVTTVDAGVYPANEGEASKICESWVGVSLIEGKVGLVIRLAAQYERGKVGLGGWQCFVLCVVAIKI